jgi:hypothetical protein
MVIEIKENSMGKVEVKIDAVVIGDNYSSYTQACKKLYKYLQGQNK